MPRCYKHKLEKVRERRRCTGSYTNLRKTGMNSVAAGKLSKLCTTVCEGCDAYYCLDCFNEKHKNM